VDEKAARKGHSYLTLVYDIAGGTVEYIADDRKQASLDPYFESFSAHFRGARVGGGQMGRLLPVSIGLGLMAAPLGIAVTVGTTASYATSSPILVGGD
jgi:hypothetical protein